MRVQKCSVELKSNEMLFVDRVVDMNRCIGLTRSKLLYPLRHEAISLASLGFFYRNSNTYSVDVLYLNDLMCFAISKPFFSSFFFASDNSEMLKTEAVHPEPKNCASIKTGIADRKIETHELLMIQIILVWSIYVTISTSYTA